MTTPAQQTAQIRSLLQTQFWFVVRELGGGYSLNTVHNDTEMKAKLAAFEKEFEPILKRLAGKAERVSKKAGQW